MLRYSVIVPVYNAQAYLKLCLDSVLCQDTSYGYEIILVNDGSTDGSGQLCDQLACEHSCIRVVHQKNQGVSAARNAGIQTARGQYILFLDSDDFWSTQMLTTLDTFSEETPDIIEFGYQYVYEDGTCKEAPSARIPRGETGREYLDEVFRMSQMPVIASWAAAYRRFFLLDNELAFPMGVQYAEDFDFRMRCLDRAQCVVGVEQSFYNYRMNNQSATHTLSARKMSDLLSTCAKIYYRHPYAVLADYYCMNIIGLSRVSRQEAQQVKQILENNQGILDCVQGKKACIAKTMFRLFGWYGGAKLIQFLIKLKHVGKNERV